MAVSLTYTITVDKGFLLASDPAKSDQDLTLPYIGEPLILQSRPAVTIVCGPSGPRVKIIILNILPESKRHELNFSLKMAFMFLAIILKRQGQN